MRDEVALQPVIGNGLEVDRVYEAREALEQAKQEEGGHQGGAGGHQQDAAYSQAHQGTPHERRRGWFLRSGASPPPCREASYAECPWSLCLASVRETRALLRVFAVPNRAPSIPKAPPVGQAEKSAAGQVGGLPQQQERFQGVP